MSNLAKSLESECRMVSGCDALRQIISPKARDLGGFSVKRILPSRGMKAVGPWVFFDHMGPATFAAGDGINVRPHPHIGLATVTYLFEGQIQHKDSLGTDVAVLPGDINLMVAGHGIVHSERQTTAVTKQSHHVHGLQLWLALPQSHEQCEPAFHHYDSTSLPNVNFDGGHAKILIGGTSLGPRYIDWNFVATDKNLIETAKQRWQQQQFPSIPGDADDFIPLP